MTTVVEQKLFDDIGGMDDSIASALEAITDDLAIVICAISLPPGEVFRLTSKEYGVYLLSRDNEGERIVRGVRVEKHHGQGSKNLVLQTIQMVLSVLGSQEPKVKTLDFSARYE